MGQRNIVALFFSSNPSEMNKLLLSIVIFIHFNMQVQSQNTENTFDFWVGNWDAYWNDSLKGTNIIKKTLKDKVVEENFKFNDKTFVGKSWSVFDPNTKTWKQTWVDDSGAYLLFTGGQEGKDVVLTMTDTRILKGKTVYMRMTFYNIEKNSFDWDWQSSEDKEKWNTVWAIKYKRNQKKPKGK